MSKANTSVTSLKTSNEQEYIIIKNDEVNSIYEMNLTNVFLSEGTLKKDVIDEASKSSPDYFITGCIGGRYIVYC